MIERGRWQQGDLSGRKRRSDDYNRRSLGCFVSVVLWKKMLATSKSHERLRAVATMAVATEGDMGYDHKGLSSRGYRGSSSGRVGDKLSLDNEEIRGNLS
ncbi:hypothetical protein BHE74_00045716 [Ensete ventricosum]|nr:hypothetical protein GW17_00050117 [Ensete ventricosum]RWW48229.1 hypothetical protein BHE74_00045716 [Ensete ventricosum]